MTLQGFAASGKTVPDKAPIPFLPEGIKVSADEGFGEGIVTFSSSLLSFFSQSC